MAWRLTGAKPLSELELENQNITILIQENAFENVFCKSSVQFDPTLMC